METVRFTGDDNEAYRKEHGKDAPFSGHAGVDVTYYRNRLALTIGGWYDSFVGIAPTNLTLADFLKRIGVRPADLRKVLREWEGKP